MNPPTVAVFFWSIPTIGEPGRIFTLETLTKTILP